jgi:hypothetical protein
MNTVTTIQELKKSLFADGQGSGTLEGWIDFEGQKFFVRKHWSYDGGYPAYFDEACTQDAGEFKRTGEPFHYMIDGNPQYRHGVPSWPIYDSKISLSK